MSALRQTFPYLRAVHNFNTRHKKSRRTEFELFITPPNGKMRTVRIPTSDLPEHAWIMPTYPVYPALTCDRVTDPEPRDWGNQASVSTKDTKRLLAKYGCGPGTNMVINLGVINDVLFTQMLAKVGHAFAYGVVGNSGFVPVLPEFILSGRAEQRNHFVGIDPTIPREGGMWQKASSICELDLCHIRSPSSVLYLCAKIRLMSFLGAPGYVVVVGESLIEEGSISHFIRYEVPFKNQLGL